MSGDIIVQGNLVIEAPSEEKSRVQVRTTTGQGRVRADLWLGPTFSEFEVTPKQLEELRADPYLLVRHGPDTGTSDVSTALGQVDTSTLRVAELEAQLRDMHKRHEALQAEHLASSQFLDQATRLPLTDADLVARPTLHVEPDAHATPQVLPTRKGRLDELRHPR